MVFGEGVTLYEVKNEGYPDPSNERASIWKNLDKRGDNHGQMLSLTVTKIMALLSSMDPEMKTSKDSRCSP